MNSNTNPLFPEEAESLPLVSETDTESDDDDDLVEYEPNTGIPKLRMKEADYPPIIREFVQSAPANRKHAVRMCVLSPLCALSPRVIFDYPFDRREHGLLLQVILEAVASTGKGFVHDIVKRLIGTTLEARDDAMRLAEQIYREKKAARKANESIGQPPPTTIVCLPASTSKTVINKRADLYKRSLGDFPVLWVWSEELAMLNDAGKSAYSNLRTILRCAYDGSRIGIDYNSDQSYSAISSIKICSLMCATPYDVDQYMDKKSILGGNVTRTILVQMEDELGSGAAEFKNLTPEQEQIISRTLQQMMDNIYTADGALQPTAKIDMGFLERDIRHWCRKKGEEALLSGNQALDVFRKRSSVSAARASTLCYYLYLLEQDVDIRAFCEGKASLDEKVLAKIHKNVRKLYRYFSESILSALMNRWGEKYNELSLKHQNGAEIKPTARLIDLLTTEFTRQQLEILRDQQNYSTDVRFLLSQWYRKGWIEKIAKNQYRKLV